MLFKNSTLEMKVGNYLVLKISDNLERKRGVSETSTCDLLVEFSNENTKIVEEVKGFEYSGDAWEDEDVDSYIQNILKQ